MSLPFAETVAATREALAAEGFGVLTEIDMQATMKAKLDEDYPPLLILGACNPQFAHQAMGITEEIATLVPCNVVVRETGDGGRAGRDEQQRLHLRGQGQGRGLNRGRDQSLNRLGGSGGLGQLRKFRHATPCVYGAWSMLT